MATIDEIWAFSLVVILIIVSPFLLRKIHSDYKTKAELSIKSVIFVYIFFGLFTMTILNAALYTRWIFAPDNLLYRLLGYVFTAAGVLIIAEAFIEFGSFKRVSGLQADEVVSTGVYRFSRNPQYLAIFLFLTGFSLCYRSIIAFVLIPVFLMIVHVIIIPGEERYLNKELGESYFQYKNKVRKWL